MATSQWCFGDFRLDPANACLWRGTQVIALTPKAFDVLHYLVSHPERLVTKDTLLDAVWPETAVSDVVVRVAIGELRRALGDTAQGSRYIATVQRRGYRFVAPVIAYAEASLVLMGTPPVETTSTLPRQEMAPRPPRLSPSAAERRHLTVLFCDLVRSTALSTQLDPEDYREVVHAYHQRCAEVIQRFEGYVAQYLGDGVLVYFGYPMAHEDDAQRAVRAGLALLETCATLATHPALPLGEQLAVRLGVHTGLVVVGDVGAGARHEQLALGETPNIAARLQHLAEPNTLVLSTATQQLVAGYFLCKSLGLHMLHGLAQPMEVYRVLGPSGIQSRLEVAATHGLTPLVGRDQEVGLLQACWTRVVAGMGQVVLLEGEAGIGKSRLVQVLTEHVAEAGHAWLECQGSPYYQHTILYPLTELLARRLLSLEPAATAAQHVQHLEAFLAQQGLSPAETVPLLAPLLSLPLPDTYAPLQVSPEQQRQQTLHALLRLVLCLAAAQPLLLVLEDLHWVDPSTLEWLSLLVDQGPTTRLLTLCTSRPDYTPAWTGRSHCTRVTLARLPQRQATALTHQVAQGKTLPAEVVAQIVAKTDGVPLFVEEVTKTVLESGLLQEQAGHYALVGSLPALAIPVTLHDALLARLDRMGTAKSLAQLGATLGREFSYTLLQAMTAEDEETVRQELQQLVGAEVLYQRGLPPQALYVFKHALIQDAAYQSLLKRTRQQYHQHIAQVLEAQFPETVATQPELLAHHYTEAGLGAPALDYWQRAGEQALQRSAHVEAISHLRKGLEVLQGLPTTPERFQQELKLQLTLGMPLSATRGYAAPEVANLYRRAQELCQRLGETPQLIPALLGLWRFYSIRGELGIARELAEQCLLLTQRVGDPARLIVVHDVLGETLFFLGEFLRARSHLEQAVALYDPQRRRPHRALTDPGLSSLSMLAGNLWILGYPAQAQQQITTALRQAEALTHPHVLAGVWLIAAHCFQLWRDVRMTQVQAEAIMTVATEQGLPVWLAEAAVFVGWAQALQGQGAAGVARSQHGVATRKAVGSDLAQPMYLGMLAEAHACAGDPTTGLTVLADALALANTTGDRWGEAELHRLRGTLLLAVSADQAREAEACFHQALTVARRQEAKAWELRTATSLSRLWQQQGKRAEAYELLAPIYGWFTEGFDTADLQEAKALLEELAR